MGFWDTIKKVAGTIGDIGKVAAPFLGLTGIGTPLAAILGGASGLLGTLNDKDPSILGALGSGATGALSGFAGSRLLGGGGGGSAAPEVGRLPGADLLGRAGALAASGMSSGAGTAGATAAMAPGTSSGILGKVWDAIKSNPGLAIGTPLAIMSALDSRRQSDRANAREDEIFNMQKDQFKSREGFRNLLGTQLLKPPPEPVDYTNQFTDLGNPFTRSRLARALG